jgi:hypothetical protein
MGKGASAPFSFLQGFGCWASAELYLSGVRNQLLDAAPVSPGSNPGSAPWMLRALCAAFRLGASNPEEAPMTPAKVLSMFERQYLEGKTPVDLEPTCASFASWLAATWEQLDGEQRTLLLTVGAALWREGYDLRAGTATKDLW